MSTPIRPRPQLPEAYKAALERLITIAKRDTGQSRRVANFLLAWWNASENGGFDLTDLWNVDEEIGADMVAVFRIIGGCRCYPDTLGYKKEFEEIWKLWREDNDSLEPSTRLSRSLSRIDKNGGAR